MSIEKSIIKRNVKLLCVIIWLVSVIMYGYISFKYDIEIAGIFDNAINILKDDKEVEVSAIQFVDKLKNIFISRYMHMIIIAITQWIKYFTIILTIFIGNRIDYIISKKKNNKIYIMDLFENLIESFGLLSIYNIVYSFFYNNIGNGETIFINVIFTSIYNIFVLIIYKNKLNKNEKKIMAYILWLMLTIYEISYYIF
ncbi:hypothetical protein [Agathobacter rectalis]|uniref:Uncharacterized protein n=1 Tax=Agathobacter rectalis TaxID=39491 RepID=A0A413DMB1_9FIRM|nr:hypothetical protein [Agathobacter rectalis]RGW87387.1 hypothetical protein DWV45_08130 [Agathobacter rectalis]